jgi:hypothetical protein
MPSFFKRLIIRKIIRTVSTLLILFIIFNKNLVLDSWTFKCFDQFFKFLVNDTIYVFAKCMLFWEKYVNFCWHSQLIKGEELIKINISWSWKSMCGYYTGCLLIILGNFLKLIELLIKIAIWVSNVAEYINFFYEYLTKRN